jgi:hypothetical protein
MSDSTKASMNPMMRNTTSKPQRTVLPKNFSPRGIAGSGRKNMLCKMQMVLPVAMAAASAVGPKNSKIQVSDICEGTLPPGAGCQ